MPPLDKKEAAKLIRLRHPEYEEHQRRWRFLQDSLEGGNRYRYANYVDPPLDAGGGPTTPWYANSSSFGPSPGPIDPTTGQPQRVFYGVKVEANLIPHLSETTVAGAELYALRLERTPVPTLLPRAVRKHLGRIYGREVARIGPPDLEAWWKDVDGTGRDIDQYMRETVAPLLLVLGQLDLCFDHPPPPEGAAVASQADVRRYGLDGCVIGYILPENLPWWRLDPRTRRYAECLVFERDEAGCRWRHWTAEESNAYDLDGEWVGGLSRAHPFGRVPIERFFAGRKARCGNVGQSAFEAVAELQREKYNKDSEIVLADVFSSHPTLQGPEEMVTGGTDGDQVAVGPGKVLPKKKDMGANGNVTYEGWEYVEAKMAGIDALRQHAQDVADEADREASLLKPAGQSGRSTTAQSGISKQMDEREANDVLADEAQKLADCEVGVGRWVLAVRADGRTSEADVESVRVVYPKQFNLATATDLMELVVGLQGSAVDDGRFPLTKAEALKRAVHAQFVGVTDDDMKAFDDEIDAEYEALAADKAQQAEAGAALAAEGTPFGPDNPPPDPNVSAAAIDTAA